MKPSPSKGLGLQLAPPDYQSFLRPWSEERQLDTFYQVPSIVNPQPSADVPLPPQDAIDSFEFPQGFMK